MMIVQFIILQVIVFSAVIFFMKKILSSDTQAAVGRLDTTYQDLITKQKELNEKIEEAEKEYAAKKEEAVQVLEKMKLDANDEARKKKDEILKQAKTQADEILERAKASSDEIYKKIEREVRAKAVDDAALILLGAVQKHTVIEFHSKIFEDFLEKGKDFDLSKVSPQIDTMTVKTPYPLTDQQKSKLNMFVSTKVNRNLKMEEIIDESQIAGISLLFGSLILEGSLANTIREVAEDKKQKIQLGE